MFIGLSFQTLLENPCLGEVESSKDLPQKGRSSASRIRRGCLFPYNRCRCGPFMPSSSRGPSPSKAVMCQSNTTALTGEAAKLIPGYECNSPVTPSKSSPPYSRIPPYWDRRTPTCISWRVFCVSRCYCLRGWTNYACPKRCSSWRH